MQRSLSANMTSSWLTLRRTRCWRSWQLLSRSRRRKLPSRAQIADACDVVGGGIPGSEKYTSEIAATSDNQLLVWNELLSHCL